MGHASIATTNLYLHLLGTARDRAGSGPSEPLAGYAGGHTRGPASGPMTRKKEPRPSCVSAGRDGVFSVVELRGFEPLTFSLRTRRATNCATAPSASTFGRGGKSAPRVG